MKRCVIVGGAPINDYNRIKGLFGGEDYVIVCDSGLKHLDKLCLTPNLIIGDFDSCDKPKTNIETIVLPREKDDTDSFFAVKEAVRRGFDEFLIFGAIGGRLDHSLGNISILLYLQGLGKRAKIVDDFSVMEIVSSYAEIDDSYSYFSLLAIDGAAEGVSIENAKFPLKNARISADYQYGISNEVIKGKIANVNIKKGVLLLIKVF